MPALSPERLTSILLPYYPALTPALTAQLSTYLDLLVKWNARTNLTAIRDPEEMVRRHFGESLFAAALLPEAETLLDIGSGAGFPGLPMQLALPHLHVTLAESQNKKASFLREACRVLGLPATVWAARVEEMPEQQFDLVTLRAVDNPRAALALARQRLRPGGTIAHLTTLEPTWERTFAFPGSRTTGVHLLG